MEIDFEEFISTTPQPANVRPLPFAAARSGDTDDLIRQLNTPPGTGTSSMYAAAAAASAPPAAPQLPSVYRPAAPPSYTPPANQFAASRPPQTTTAAAPVQGGGGGGGWLGGMWTFFSGGKGGGGGGGGGGAAPQYHQQPQQQQHRTDTATMMRKRKRKLLREMRSMLEADAAARARTAALTGGVSDFGYGGGGNDDSGGGGNDVYQMRSTEASSLEEIEEEHDLVMDEHNERVGMETARTTFVAALGQVEAFNDEWHPLGQAVQLQGFEEAVKSSIGDYESDIQSMRESVLGLGLPQWCYTAAKLGVTGAVIIAVNRLTQKLVESGEIDPAVAYHPKVRDAIREVTAQQLAEAARNNGGGGQYHHQHQQHQQQQQQRAGPGPPAYVNNKPRMPDPDSVPRPGGDSGAAQFVNELHQQQQYQQQQQHQPQHQQYYDPPPPPQYQHDRFAYAAPAAHSTSQPIVNVPLPRAAQNESARDNLADRAAYQAQQRSMFQGTQPNQQQQQQQQQQRPDLAPPSFGVPANFTMQFPLPAATAFGGGGDAAAYASFDRSALPRRSVLAAMGYQERPPPPFPPPVSAAAVAASAAETREYEEAGGGGGGGVLDDYTDDYEVQGDDNDDALFAQGAVRMNANKRSYAEVVTGEADEADEAGGDDAVRRMMMFDEIMGGGEEEEGEEIEIAARQSTAAAAASFDNRSVASASTGGGNKRRRRAKTTTALADDELAMSML